MTTVPRALLLDLDDTIVDDTGPVDSCWEEACHASADGGSLLSEIKAVRDWYWSDAERHRIGRLDLDTARRHIVRLAIQRLGREDDVLAINIADQYTRIRDQRLQLIPGAVETVRWFRSLGCATALLTNGAANAQRQKIARFELDEMFDVILVEGDLGFGKPDERIYRVALDALAVEPSDAWMVGDNLTWDIAPAKRLGIHAVWVDAGGLGLPDSAPCVPDRIVRKLAELQSHAKN